ncbi:hypothetical protein [Enterococcus columbae]|nr:hypothetical protein [Enterococcus columbae]HJF18925.1 hypothetical protein [Enterococcus columbae]
MSKKFQWAVLIVGLIAFFILQRWLVNAVDQLIMDAVNHLDQVVAGFAQGWANG